MTKLERLTGFFCKARFAAVTKGVLTFRTIFIYPCIFGAMPPANVELARSVVVLTFPVKSIDVLQMIFYVWLSLINLTTFVFVA
jgi:hypothetical protein